MVLYLVAWTHGVLSRHVAVHREVRDEEYLEKWEKKSQSVGESRHSPGCGKDEIMRTGR